MQKENCGPDPLPTSLFCVLCVFLWPSPLIRLKLGRVEAVPRAACVRYILRGDSVDGANAAMGGGKRNGPRGGDPHAVLCALLGLAGTLSPGDSGGSKGAGRCISAGRAGWGGGGDGREFVAADVGA